MEKLFYTVKDIQELTCYGRNKAYDIISQLNVEIREKNKNALTFRGRINKEYFDKRMKESIGDLNNEKI